MACFSYSLSGLDANLMQRSLQWNTEDIPKELPKTTQQFLFTVQKFLPILQETSPTEKNEHIFFSKFRMCCLIHGDLQLEVSWEDELLLPELLALFCPLVALTCRGTRWLEPSLAVFSPCPELVLLRTKSQIHTEGMHVNITNKTYTSDMLNHFESKVTMKLNY